MSTGSLSRDHCDKCQMTTLHDHCTCIHCGTPRMIAPAVESLGFRTWSEKLKKNIYLVNNKRQRVRRREANNKNMLLFEIA
jgi:hypothetical protein